MTGQKSLNQKKSMAYGIRQLNEYSNFASKQNLQ